VDALRLSTHYSLATMHRKPYTVYPKPQTPHLEPETQNLKPEFCIMSPELPGITDGIDYADIAEHFNALQELIPVLLGASRRFLLYCNTNFGVKPAPGEFSENFQRITQ
jgi:hypothetical protein